MKICLINPPFLFPRQENVVVSHCLGLRTLSSYLSCSGEHQVRLIDSLFLGLDHMITLKSGVLVGLPHEETVRRIPGDCELVGVSAPFSQLAPVVHDLIDVLKQRLPNTNVVTGGMYPSTQPELALTSNADYVVVGEGEQAILDLANGKDPSNIEGVYSPAVPHSGPWTPARLIQPMDTLPWPDYTIPHMGQYFSLSPRGIGGRTASLVTSRGCPCDCEFCSVHPVSGWQFRARSPANVLAEVEYVARRFDVRLLEFEDDNLTSDRERVAAIFEGLIHLKEKGLPIAWRSPNGVRIDTLDDELIALAKRSGCVEMALALEHGDQAMLDLMKKNLDAEQAFRVLESCCKHEIPKIYVFYMVGYPGETLENFTRGIRYLERVRRLPGNIRLSVNFAQPYPGTKLLARCRSAGYITDPDYGNFLVMRKLMNTQYAVSVETPELARGEVMRRRAKVASIFAPPKDGFGRRRSSIGHARWPDLRGSGKADARTHVLIEPGHSHLTTGHVLGRLQVVRNARPPLVRRTIRRVTLLLANRRQGE